MSRLFDDASTQYLENANAVVTGPPVTVAAWVYPDATGLVHVPFSVANSASNVEYYNLEVRADNTGAARSRSAAANAVAGTSTTVTINTWHHLCGVWASTSSRAAYLNGAGKGTDTNSVTHTGLNRTGIGRLSRSSPLQYFSGRIAEVAIWNVALSDVEVAALARGIAPPYLQPAALVGYWPVWGLHSPEIDLTANNRQMTVTGAVLANHAPVSPFSSRVWGTVPFISAASVARQMMYYKRLRAV